METNPKWMTWQDITALKNDGMNIQSHTMTHAHLDSVSPKKLEYEIGYAKQCLAGHGFNTSIFAYPNNLGMDKAKVVNVVAKYYSLARAGTEPLFFLNCTGYAEHPQTNCRTYASDGSPNYASRYNIKDFSEFHIDDKANINSDESNMFDKFVQTVNSQTAFNSNGKINAIPVIAYHDITNNIEDSMGSTITGALLDKEMKYLRDNGFKVLLLNQLGYDTTHNTFFIKNSSTTATTTPTTTTTTTGAATITTPAIDKSTSTN